MGLDMYAYVASKEGQHRAFWDSAEVEEGTGEFVNNKVARPHEIAYWRKHPSLHGWMHELWVSKGYSGEFNGDEVELTNEDLDLLEDAIKSKKLPHTEGFFYGDPSDEWYYEDDLNFIKEARSWIFLGMRVFYNSSW